ncbi:MAG: helix-turn-helix domain-containing protein [Gammaproteobacteria bacterium]|nr:helix-turn-helix domain-containing protein [Gammaproteobacteria bacterium]
MAKLAENLTLLMKEHDVNSCELSRNTGILQPVIYRLMHGETDNPKIATLLPIANYFSLTLNQLIGDAPLPSLSQRCLANNSSQAIKIPIINWEQAVAWPQISNTESAAYLPITTAVGKDAFILQMKGTTMEPRFPDGTLLLIDTSIPYKDKDFVIAHIEQQPEVIFRQLLFDGNNIALKPLNSDFKTIYLEKNKDRYSIKGVLVEARISCKNNLK